MTVSDQNLVSTNFGAVPDFFESIFAMPKAGEKLEDIGMYKKSNLKPTHNLKSIFKAIRGWIVANGNVTRDETIASQVILLMLCKIYDEKFTKVSDDLKFRASVADKDSEIKKRIGSLFAATKEMYGDVISKNDEILFDGKTLRGIVGQLQSFSILATDRDCMADAFEVFIDKAVKEKEGQFFTPRNVVNVLVEAVNITEKDKLIDSACGSGGFLVEALKRVETRINKRGKECGWSEAACAEAFKKTAIKNFRGLEKDPFLTKLSKSYMAILGDGSGGIFREDSLAIPSEWAAKTQTEIQLGTFDALLANPPFGKNIKVEGKKKLEQYCLAYAVGSSGKKTLRKAGNVSTLFLERNLQFVRNGGRVGIILPEPYFALPKYLDAIKFMFKGNNVTWVIDLPQDTFRPHNNAKCCAVVIQKGEKQQSEINMAVIDYVGHDQQGKILLGANKEVLDDTPDVIKEIADRNEHGGRLRGRYKFQRTFQVKASTVLKSGILVPRYYWKSGFDRIKVEAKKKGIVFVSMATLLAEGVISYFDGHGSPDGKLKGTGEIPYIRVKDIVNWQPYVDVTSLIPRDEYDKLFSKRKTLKAGDILYVSRGSYRIGSVAMVSPYDGEMLLTREIKVFRMQESDNKYGITPEYLLYALSHRYVWEQTKAKVFYEPCLPNIAERWKEIMIPIPANAKEYRRLKEMAREIVAKQWDYKKGIQDLRAQADAFMI